MIAIADAMFHTSFCALGQSLIMPIRSAIEHFKADFEKRFK
jgi:NADH:ubiquinone oxidoreductase subunit F (NADH-binding)